MDTQEILNEVNKTISGSLEKSLPEIVDTAVKAQVASIEEKTVTEIEAIKAELKNINLTAKKSNPQANELIAKTAIVEGFKAVAKGADFRDSVVASYKTMNEGTDTEGAELVFDQFERDVIRVIDTYDVLALTRAFTILKGDKLTFPKKTGSTTASIVGEGGTTAESEMTTGNIPVDIYKISTLTGVTNELLDDTMTVPDFYNLLVEDVAEQVASLREDLVLGGTGSSQPRGITQTSGINTVALGAGETVADIDDTNLVDVITKADKKYKRGNPVWIFSQYVRGKLMALKTTDGYPLYPELRNFSSPSLMGRRVVITDSDKLVQDATGDVAGANVIVFWDLSYFYSVNRMGMIMEKWHLANDFRDGKTSFRSTTRFGGAVAIAEAFTVLTNWA